MTKIKYSNYITKKYNLRNITHTNKTCKNRVKIGTIPAYMAAYKKHQLPECG